MKITITQLNKIIKNNLFESILTDRAERDRRRKEQEAELDKSRQNQSNSTGPYNRTPQAEKAYYKLNDFFNNVSLNKNLYVEIMENFENVTRNGHTIKWSDF